MSDATAMDLNMIEDSIASAIPNVTQKLRFPEIPSDRKELWGVFAGDHQPVSRFIYTQRGVVAQMLASRVPVISCCLRQPEMTVRKRRSSNRKMILCRAL